MSRQTPVKAINVGKRRREDYGDIDALAASIAEHGLLHPIVVDAFGNLVAGGRRLLAVEQLGWTRVPVTTLGELSAAELREIELEENLQRKDLTAIERSRNLVQLAETAAEASARTPRESNGGRPSDPTSDRQVAARIGVGATTLRDAREHVAAVDEFPELAPEPQTTAIQKARTLRAPVSEEALIEQQRQTSISVLDRAVFALDGSPDTARAIVGRILEGGDAGPLTPSRFDRVVAYATAAAAALRKAGIDG